ncbi:MAG: hypothetical protein RLZZ519_1955 [Bacteroidota bacterium]|jgi:hypothetical protein
MKKKIYLLALVCLFSTVFQKSFSQSYLSIFGNSTTDWDIVEFGACDAICSGTVTVVGDTTISGVSYKRLNGLSGFLREDSTQGKAWYYDTTAQAEFLVMDLNLSVGDTFDLYDYSNVAHPHLVDSVYISGNRKHVRLDVSTVMCAYEEKITFVEGSGTTVGFHYQRQYFNNSVSSAMLCHHKDGVKAAGNTLFNDVCFFCDVAVDEAVSDVQSIHLFPNPAQDQLNIELRNFTSRNAKLTIYDAVGKYVETKHLVDALTTMDISQLSQGIYYAILRDGLAVQSVKFVKN